MRNPFKRKRKPSEPIEELNPDMFEGFSQDRKDEINNNIAMNHEAVQSERNSMRKSESTKSLKRKVAVGATIAVAAVGGQVAAIRRSKSQNCRFRKCHFSSRH
jgi:hypothetical protein